MHAPGHWGPCVAAALASCTGGGAGSDAATDDPGDGADACVPEPGETIDLTGQWGARAWIHVDMVTSPEGIVRMCPDPNPGVSILTLLIDLEPAQGGAIPYEFVVCEIGMPTVTASLAPCAEEEFLSVTLALGPDLAAYIPGQRFRSHAVLGGSGPCSPYVSDDLDITYGYDPSIVGPDDPLPGWDLACAGATPEACVTSWEAVRDEDGDGNPGVSLEVTTDPVDTIRGLAWTTWRTNPHMHGVAWTSSLIQGDLSPVMEYDVVGSGADLQGIPMDGPTVKRNIPSFVIPESGSTFRMVRIDGRYGAVDLDVDGDGTVSCAELMDRLDVLE